MRAMTTEAYIKDRRNINYVNTVLFAVLLPLVAWILIKMHPNLESSSIFIFTMAGMTIFIVVEMLILTYILVRKMRLIGYDLDEFGISKLNKFGSPTNPVAYSDIKQVTAIFLKDGMLRLIKINAGKKSITLVGIENLTDVLAELKMNVDETKYKEKTAFANWYSMKTNIISIFIAVPIVLALLIFSGKIYVYLNEIFFIGFALYLIIFKPMTKYYGAKSRKFEIGLSVLLILSRVLDYLNL